MSFDKDQNENSLPVENKKDQRSFNFLPKYFRTEFNKKFLSSTLDQMTVPGVVEKVNAFAGRRWAKAATSNDNYLKDVSVDRENYQLEPSVVYKDEIGNVEFLKDYNDYFGQIKSFKGSTSNHSLTNSQEFYTWNPHIDWDKFTNYREYYWLPFGPMPIPVAGQARSVVSTYTVKLINDGESFSYVFTPDGLTRNPTIKLYRGQTYRFKIDALGQPFAIAISRQFIDSDPGFGINITNLSSLYKEGVTADSDYVEEGVIEFTVPDNAPDVLYYISKNDVNTSGQFLIYNVQENSDINVETEILGKETYKTSNGVELSNGMKVYFQGNVVPAKYAKGNWYVEGVGDAIKLVSETDLEVPTIFTSNVEVPFDTTAFDIYPYENATSFAGTKDYIVINRASADRNPWSRYNRWFHKSVIEQSALINGQNLELDQLARATRPIIEFEAGLKLFKHGCKSKNNVDLVDDFTKDVFSTVEGSYGYNVDNVDLVNGMRVLFTADTDSVVNGKIFEVKFITHNNNRQITLIETDDSAPSEGETVLVTNGVLCKGKMFYYENGKWLMSQEKTGVNQPPLFDMYDSNGYRYNDELIYPSSTFAGNKVFSYKVGTGTADSELGFPLTYRNISNIGDIVFDFNVLSETYSYQTDERTTVDYNSDLGFLKKFDYQGNSFSYVNGWVKADKSSEQAVIRNYVVATEYDSFNIDVFDNSANLSDLRVVVFLNGNRMKINEDYRIERTNNYSYVVFNSALTVGDIVLLKCYSKADKNSNGYYEIPYNFEKNPLNENITSFTLGEVNDHVDSIVENLTSFAGNYPGVSNLRDLGSVTKYGRRFLQHTGPLNLSLFHITDKNANIIKSIKYVKKEYSKFKRQFLYEIEQSGFDGSVKDHVDYILRVINKDKVKSQPFYFSDMLGYEVTVKTVHNVNGSNTNFFALSEKFSLNELSIRSVNIYLNGIQLVCNKDYTFQDNFVHVTKDLFDNDVIEVYEYESTYGSYIPPTPTKLGLYPKYEPQIVLDDTLFEPRTMIQGHDGSLMLAFGDYRDELILELEKRIYNNIKVDYQKTLLDINDFIGGKFRDTNISKEKIDSIIISDFSQWLDVAGSPNYTSQSFWDKDNPFTYNYSSMTDRDGQKLSGFWRNIYKNFFDTDRPHTHPWEMLGFTIQPVWWESVYGPAPYTKNNTILWNDLSEGVIREPGKPVIRNYKYARPQLLNIIPVDDNGNLADPISAGIAQNFVLTKTQQEFLFGDNAPVETAWKRSSDYPYAILAAWTLLQPSKVFSLGFDVSRTVQDLTGAIVYKETGKRITTKDIVFPTININEELVLTSGLINFVSNYLSSFKVTSEVNKKYEQYKDTLKGLTNQLAIKLGGFADKSKIKLVLDSRSPLNKSSVFIPDENYKIVLNTSSPLDTVVYSGIVIEKVERGFVVSGYDREDPVFRFNKPLVKAFDPSITVGGISESFVSWNSNKTYVVGKVVEYQGFFYRTKITHVSGNTFDTEKFTKLASLPVVGGVTATFRTGFETVESTIPYGSFFGTIQEVVDFMLGYENYNRELGFKLEFFNKETNLLEDMSLCVKEFMFWVTQNWDIGTVLSVSPIANRVLFERANYVVDDIYNDFYEYTVLSGNNTRLSKEFISVFRDTSNQFGVKPINTDSGIYLIKLPLVQKEHVILVDNITVFNDIIFDKVPGYRQERIKLVGYRTADWNGGLNIPGFFYDEAKINLWKPWTDYALGDLVKYKEFYYSANLKHTSSDFFDANQWKILDDMPEAELLPNWDYRTNQISEFYDLESDNFDSEQQRLSQHLIGYQKREYLANIINDDVSQYKFYQGFIQDKGTLNSLTKLFDSLNRSNMDSLEFYEEWAVRIGNYGATTNIEEVELILNEQSFRQEPQNIELVSTPSTNRLDLVYEMLPTEVYLKPDSYNHRPFPILETAETYTKDKGYVRDQDVNYIVNSVEDILNLNIDLVDIGNYIWLLNYENSWSVWRHVETDAKVVDITATGDGFSLTLDKFNTFSVGDVIGLNSFNQRINGFYKIKEVGLRSISVESELITGQDIEEFVDSTIKAITTFVKRRFNSYEDINNSIYKLKKVSGEKVWLDNFNNTWAVLENKNIFEQYYEIESKSQTLTNFGKSFDLNKFNTVMAVGAPDEKLEIENQLLGGVIKIYKRYSENLAWELSQEINPSLDYGLDSKYGHSISITSNAKYIAVGAPESTKDATKQGAVYLFVKDNSDRYILKNILVSELVQNNEMFGYTVQYRTTENGVTLFVGAPGSNRIYVYNVDNVDVEFTTVIERPTTDFSSFGKKLDVNSYGDVLLVGTTKQVPVTKEIFNVVAEQYVLDTVIIEKKSVLVYRSVNNAWMLDQELSSDNTLEDYGYSFAIDSAGDFVAIGAPKNDANGLDNGCVYVYKQNNGEFVLTQTIRSPFTEYNEMFGSSLDFSENKLVISSKNGDLTYPTTFDENTTQFDNITTTFVDTTEDVGKIYVYQKLNETFVYSEDLIRLPLDSGSYDSVSFETLDLVNKLKFNSISNFKIVNNKIYLSIPEAETLAGNKGIIVEFSSPLNSDSWSILTKQELKVDLSKIKRCFLYNKKENKIVSTLDFIDPRQGKIAGIAEQELSFKTFYDPAIYSNNDGNVENVNVDITNSWANENVGKLWWNLDTAGWYNPYQGSTIYRSSWWNKLTFNSEVVVCEWVEADISPSEWRRISETNEGISRGITGLPLYENTYTSKKVYDPIANRFSNKFYYWVKNKRNIPQVNNRALSAFEVAKLIEAPEQLGYKFVTFLSDNSFALYNVKNLVEDKNTVVHFTITKNVENESNIHFEYQLLTEGLDTSVPASTVEQKWIDSLVGYNLNNQKIPDPNLSVKEKYGILDHPRQGMFINRYEALKQVVERANSVLLKNLTVDTISNSVLYKKDPTPIISSGMYDEAVDNRTQLQFVSVAKVEQAILEPIIVDGKIISVNIVNPGRGYKNKPTIDIETISGAGAVLDVELDNLGKIARVNVKRSGRKYAETDKLLVRKFSVLVRNDSLIKNKWSVVEWDKTSSSWIITDNEKYDTTRYWSFVDWYEEGYSELSNVKFIIDESYQLYALNDDIGDIIKIKNVGTGGWLLLEKTNNLRTEDYSLNYKTVGRQNGTIQLSKEIYDYAFKVSGFDVTVYDSQLYDNEPIEEARNILLALKNSIFVGVLAVEWNKLFFASVRYALSEQNFVDWIFKTSFIRAKHNLGVLTQKRTFQNDNLESYEAYVKEAKPYSTKIREYISNYLAEDNTQSLITDFDLQPSYNDTESYIEVSSAKAADGVLTNLNPKYEEYPYKSWLDNVGFELVSIEVVDPGKGYLQTPTVTISGVQGSTAKAYIGKGKLLGIEIVNAGGKFLKTPTITIEGNIEEGGRPARAVAVLGNSNVRSTTVGMKFDRVSGNFDVHSLAETENFVGTGAKQTFNLKWPVDVRKGTYKVYVDNILILETDYSVGNIIDFSKGYTRRSGYITFNVDPLLDSQVRVEYTKDITLLTAADRIRFFYKPTDGMPGNDLAQLMDGIDYSGVKLDSVGFGTEQGWDVGGWSSLPWDTFNNISEDIILVLNEISTTIDLPQALETGVEYNVYLNNIRIDDPNFGTALPVTNENSTVKTIIGAGQVSLPVSLLGTPVNDGDVFILRKTTSDGSFVPPETAYDVALTGGTFGVSSAAGVAAGEIIVDGDGFVTPTTSKGPEELIPGQVLDTLDIKVYNKPTTGAGIISTNNYLLNETNEYYFETLPQSNDSIIVKVDNTILDSVQYGIDYENQIVTLSPDVTGTWVSITSVGTNGLRIDDTGSFIADGSVNYYITQATWKPNSYAFISRNGLVLTKDVDYTVEIVEKNVDNRVKIVFSSLSSGDVIVYSVYSEEVQSYSQMIIDNTFQTGNSNNYHIFDNVTNPIPFNRKPIAQNILVKVGNKILSPGYSIAYNIDAAREYEVESWQFEDITSIKPHEVLVFVDGTQLRANDYVFDKINSKVIVVNEDIALAGTSLEIYIISNSDYYFIDTEIVFASNVSSLISAGDKITVSGAQDFEFTVQEVDGSKIIVRSYVNDFVVNFNENTQVTLNGQTSLVIRSVKCVNSNNLTFRVPPAANETVKIYQFSNHDINDFRRYTYEVVSKTVANLNVADAQRRNEIANGVIRLRSPAPSAKYVWVVKNGTLLTANVDYVLENANKIQLVDTVKNSDLIDVLQFGNYPIVRTFGYRIFKDILNRTHYKRINDVNSYELALPLNYYDIRIMLKDSSGIAKPNKDKNIPGVIFIDGERIEYFEIKGNALHQLRRGTLGTGIKTVYDVGTKVYGQSVNETIMYKDATLTQAFVAAGKEYDLNFTPTSANEVEVYVAGNKLRKTSLDVYNIAVAQDSTEGDITIAPEFSINNNKLVLLNQPPAGVKILVVRKLGKLWTELGESLSYAENSISRFLRSTTIDLPK